MELRKRCACRLHRLRSSGQGMWRGRAGQGGRGGERRGADGGAMYLRGNARARRVPVQVDENMNFLRVYNRDLQPSKSPYDSSSDTYCKPPPTPAHDRHRSQTPQDPQQMWPGWAQSRCRCGRGGPSPGADAGGVGPVLVQMREGWAQSRSRCGAHALRGRQAAELDQIGRVAHGCAQLGALVDVKRKRPRGDAGRRCSANAYGIFCG